MAQVIGFANNFYTLWSVSEPYKEYTSQYDFYWKVQKSFIRNLSTDFVVAKSKITGDYEVDLNLRGHYRKVRISGLINEGPLNLFPFGKLKGEEISTSTDVWQLNRLYESYKNASSVRFRRIGVIARRRLVELGELVKCTYKTMEYRNDVEVEITYNYTTPNHAASIQNRKDISTGSGHFFNDGDKVVLTLTEIASTHFDTQFGTTYIITYKDEEGRIFKYMGASPINFNNDTETVKATVKHSEYNGVAETKLQRMKIA